MSQIESVLKKLEGTSVYDILINVENAYERISREQGEWYDKTHFFCPSGCGKCCEGFEPDLSECEALYMAAWLLENQPFITSMAFTGLILGGVPMTIKGQQDGYMRDKNKSQIVNVILFIIFAAIALAMTFMSGDSESGIILTADAITILKMFFLGIIAAATMVIPGVSGSLVLMILGYYFGIITAVKDFLSALKDFDFEKLFNLSLLLVPFGVGCILGIFFISKLISWMFNHFASATYSAILGLIITAPISIFYKVNDEYGLSSTTIPQIILSVIILAACIAGTLYMGNLETSDDKEAKQ